MNQYVAIPITDADDEFADASVFNPENIRDRYYASKAFAESGEASDPDVFFEHDQWFIRTDDGDTERTYSVVLCGSESGESYLDFELLDVIEY